MTAIGCLKSVILAAFWLILAPTILAQTESPAPEISAGSHGAPVNDRRLDQALAAYETDDQLQRTRPPAKADVPFEPPTRRPPNPFLQAIADFFRAIGGVLGYALAGLVFIAILAGLYMMFGEQLALRRRQKPKPSGPDLSVQNDFQPGAVRARALLDEADALAAEGCFDEAVHLLLFRSIHDIQERTRGVIRQSFTAREIGTLDVLPGPVRATLFPIIQIVERSFFGGRKVNEAGWRDARAAYQDFAFGSAWA